MFKVKEIGTDYEYTVYAVQETNEGIMFLLFIGDWDWKHAYNYYPID